MTGCGPGAGCQALDTLRFALAPSLDGLAGAVRGVHDAVPLFWPLCAAVVGAIVASLAGLFVDRYPRMLGWHGEPEEGLGLARPASRCGSCGDRIPPLALVPVVGWLMSEGRCGSCFEPVPRVYPIVEAATSLASTLLVAALGPTPAALAACVLLWALVPVAWLDWREEVIPDGATVPLGLVGLLASPFEADAWSRGAGAAAATGLVWLAFKLVDLAVRKDAGDGQGAMSLGDVALGGAMGAWIGVCHVPSYLVASVLCYLAYAVPPRLRSGRVWVPMGPALAAGALVTAVGCALVGSWP